MADLKRCMVPLFVALAVLAVVDGASATSKFCSTSANTPLCEEITKGATDWTSALVKAITESLNRLNKVSNTDYKTRLHKAKSAVVGSTTEQMCNQAYINTLDRLKESLEQARGGDKDGTLNFKLSAALTSLEDCTTAVRDLKIDMNHFIMLNYRLDLAIRVCLAIDKAHEKETEPKKAESVKVPS